MTDITDFRSAVDEIRRLKEYDQWHQKRIDADKCEHTEARQFCYLTAGELEHERAMLAESDQHQATLAELAALEQKLALYQQAIDAWRDAEDTLTYGETDTQGRLLHKDEHLERCENAENALRALATPKESPCSRD
jgi:hypothetical protein